ncbi:MAG TPA: efflux RND transporter periplasmic adaptor subunit [Myxococcales bacterium]
MRHVTRIFGYLLLVAVLGSAGWYLKGRLSPPPLPLDQRVKTAEVSRGGVTAKITATGTLSALVTVQVGSQVSGRIAELHADFNTAVRKGQLIARIDPQMFQAAVQQSKANLLAAEGNLARSRAQAADASRQFERQKSLAAQKLIAQAELDTAQANAEAGAASIQASQGAVEQAKASLHQAEINLAYTTITSPINGVVISRNVDVGQTVAASLQAPTLFTIAEDLTHMQVDTNVAEADIGKLKPDMAATFLVDAWPQAPFKGKIRQIRNAPITMQNVVTYDAVIDVENPELKLKPGMTANVSVVYAQVDDALRVPNAALRFRPGADLLGDGPDAGVSGERRGREGRGEGRGGEGKGSRPKQVWVLRGDKLVSVKLETGVTDGSFTEITSGEIKEGDQVVTESTEPAKGSGGGTSNPLGPQQPTGGGMRRVL